MIKNLSEKQKTVIRLKYAQCYHTEEIAQIMGISRQAVWQLEQRALAKLSLEYDKPEK